MYPDKCDVFTNPDALRLISIGNWGLFQETIFIIFISPCQSILEGWNNRERGKLENLLLRKERIRKKHNGIFQNGVKSHCCS